jgi:hypothetical protein
MVPQTILAEVAPGSETARVAMAWDLAVADGAVGFWQAIEEVWPEDPRPALLGTQDRQCLEQATEQPALESQAGAPGNLDG